MDQPRTPRYRVALLSEHASPLALRGSVDAGGQNTYVDEVSRGLAHQGWSVDVFTRRDDANTPEVVSMAPAVRVVHIPAGPARFLFKDELWPLMPAFRDGITRFASREGLRYDVLHGNFWMSGWVAAELRRQWSIPAVQIFHATGLTKRRHQGPADTSPDGRVAVERAVIAGVDRIIAQCPEEQRELVEDYGADPARIAVIPSGVDTRIYRPVARDEARRRIGLATSGPVVVYVGRMVPRKDVRNVVRALAHYAATYESGSDEPVVLLLVGGETREPDPRATPEIGELQRLAAELGVSDRLCFAGKRQAEEIRYYYAAGDVVVTTPWYEPFGLTPLEGQACGRPVIGSAVGGITSTIADGVTGLLVPPRDPAALAAALHRLLCDPVLCERMGRAARARVEREFTWPLVAARTAALYNELLATRGPTPQHAQRQRGRQPRPADTREDSLPVGPRVTATSADAIGAQGWQ
jgi:D-inositol-3-phosphate glycosyltransferase